MRTERSPDQMIQQVIRRCVEHYEGALNHLRVLFRNMTAYSCRWTYE